MSKPMIYKEEDFEVLTGNKTYDPRIGYNFISKDKKVMVNFFYTPGNCEVRGLVGDHGILHIQYPFLNKKGGHRPIPPASKIFRSIIKVLKRGEYQ